MSRKAEPRIRPERLAELALPSRPEVREKNPPQLPEAIAANWRAYRAQLRPGQLAWPGLTRDCVLETARSRANSDPARGELYAVSNRPPTRPITWRSEL